MMYKFQFKVVKDKHTDKRRCLTVGKIYEAIDGKFKDDKGITFDKWDNPDNAKGDTPFERLCDWWKDWYEFELVEDNKCKFKVGDKVRVCKIPTTSNPQKKKHLGEVFTIRAVCDDALYPYAMVGDNHWFWNDSELELATETVSNEKIVITVDGRTTLARLYKDGKVVKSAEARCCPEDTFDFTVGANLAYNRLMGVPTGEEKKEESKPVEPPKPKYYNGNVVCVKSSFPEYWTPGKIYEIVDGNVVDNGGDKRYFRITNVEQTRHMGSDRNEFIPLVDDINPDRPLTTEQLMKMDGKKVWLSSIFNGIENFTDEYCGWATVRDEELKDSDHSLLYFITENGGRFGFKAYLREQKAK